MTVHHCNYFSNPTVSIPCIGTVDCVYIAYRFIYALEMYAHVFKYIDQRAQVLILQDLIC